MKKTLPPLNSLRAFEAVARHLSVVKAAEELFVTHSAVSQQVKLLEDYLGMTLLDRRGGKIRVLEHATSYAAELTLAFNTMRFATEQLQSKENDHILTINLLSTFAMRWLIPRLQEFQTEFPDIEIRLSTPTHVVDFNAESIDLAIYYGDGNWPELHVDFLFDEYLVPVCSPELAKQIKTMPIASALQHYKLLYVDAEERKNAWAVWLAAANLQEPRSANQMHFQSSVQALAAAMNGLGIAIAPEGFITEDLANKRLVIPFKTRVKAPASFYLVCPARYLQRKKIKAFRNWILKQNPI